MTGVILVLFLILINALFVAAEFALIGVPRATIDKKAQEGHRLAKRLSKILHNPSQQDRYIATAQLGITLASLALGMYGEHKLSVWLDKNIGWLPLPPWLASSLLASFLAVLVLTYLHIVLGEMIPKSLALQKPEQTAYWVLQPMAWIENVMRPLVIVLNGSGNFCLKLMGVQRTSQAAGIFHTQEELEYVIKESQEGGMLKKETGEVLQDLLEFGELLAREVMVPRVRIAGIPLGATPAELLQIVTEDSHTRYLLYEGDLDHIMGSIHIKDFMRNQLANRPVDMSDARPVFFVPESATLEQVLHTMRKQGSQIVVVMDEYGGTAGLITIEDLYEEIVGDIGESEDGIPSIQRMKDGSYNVRGMVRLDEIGEKLGIDLEHEEVDTVGGLILSLLNRPPRLGDIAEYKGLKFLVTSIDGHSIEKAKVMSNPKPS